MMGSTEESLAMFGLDAGAADAARAAVATAPPARTGAPVPGPGPRAPLASPGFPAPTNGKAPPPLAPPSGQGELATASAPHDDRAPEPLEPMEEEESTRAVPREELFRGQDAHVIVGDDAVGEDATLAVGPGDNEANSKHLAALAQTMAADADAFPPPLGGFPPPNAGPVGGPMPPAMGPPPSWNDPQQSWRGGPPSAPMQPMMGPGHDRPTSNPQIGSNPHLQAAPHAMGGMPQSGQMPAGPMGMGPGQMGMPMHNMGQGPIPYPGQQGGPMMQGQNPFPWGQAPSGKRLKLSNQIILLAIVGVICLAIFITGIVLFATTKF